MEHKNRYGDYEPTEMEGASDPSDIAPIVKELRATFETEKTMSKAWRKQQLRQFIKMIDECEEELCAAMWLDLHKSYFEGYATELSIVREEAVIALKNLDKWMRPTKKNTNWLNYPGWATTRADPLGVTLVLGAWNYNVQLSLGPMVGAIAGGNCVVMKPGSYAINTSNVMARIVPLYLDQECVRVVQGNRHVTTALLEERWDMIFFTGSAFVGKLVAQAAAKYLTPTVLELGGKSPCIVDKSANLTHAAERYVFGAMLNSGQTCVRPDFLMIHESVAEKFMAKVKDCITSFYTSDAKQSPWFGRLINEAAYKRISALIDAERERVVYGGETNASDRYVSPTLVNFKNDLAAFQASPLMTDEIFGPVVPIVYWKRLEDVVSFVRTLPTGKPLGLYCFGTDAKFIDAMKARTTSGGLCINDAIMQISVHGAGGLPFGGVGNSGTGSYHGYYSFQTFTHEKAVLHKSPKIDSSAMVRPFLRARFPPYNNFKGSVVKAFGGLSSKAAQISKYGTAEKMDALVEKHITSKRKGAAMSM